MNKLLCQSVSSQKFWQPQFPSFAAELCRGGQGCLCVCVCVCFYASGLKEDMAMRVAYCKSCIASKLSHRFAQDFVERSVVGKMSVQVNWQKGT